MNFHRITRTTCWFFVSEPLQRTPSIRLWHKDLSWRKVTNELLRHRRIGIWFRCPDARMDVDSVVFILSLVDCAFLLFLSVYFIITLSDLECDYINATQCCSRYCTYSLELARIFRSSHRWPNKRSMQARQLHWPPTTWKEFSNLRFAFTVISCPFRLNSWVLIEVVVQSGVTVLMFLTFHYIFFIVSGILSAWLVYQWVKLNLCKENACWN